MIEGRGDFFDVVLFGRQGESINQYLTKGKQVAIQGELRQDRWEQDGQSRSKVEIVATNVQLLGGGGGSGGSGERGSGNQDYRSQHEQSPKYRDQGAKDDFNDDIPF